MKILVRTPNWLGDAVMSTPFLKRLGVKFPGAEIDLLAKPAVAGVFAGMPGLRKILPLDGPLSNASSLRKEGYDASFILPVSFSSAWAIFRAGIPERTGHAGEFRTPLLTKTVPLDERFHYVRRYLSLIGEESRDVVPEDFYFPSGDSPALPEGPILAVAPGSRAPARRWDPDRFAEVINNAARFASVILLGSREDVPWANDVQKLSRPKVLNLCGKSDLPTLGAILKKCAALVTNESGLMHAAWAVGTPTVIVAGPSDPRCTSPFGADVRILQRREIPCVPCVRNDCFRLPPDHQACLKTIPPREVIDALTSLSRP